MDGGGGRERLVLDFFSIFGFTVLCSAIFLQCGAVEVEVEVLVVL